MFDETETIDGNPKSWAAWKREAERLQKIIDEMTTNNHPAHGPVSLDRLHQIREILSKAAAQSDGGNLGYAMADAVKVIDGAIAAFGAEPVAWQWEYRDKRHVTNDQRRAKIVAEDGEVLVQPLYTAPPAPPAPVVPLPDAVSVLFNHLEDVLPDDAFNLIDVKTWNAVSMLTCPDACRAAMLQGKAEFPAYEIKRFGKFCANGLTMDDGVLDTSIQLFQFDRGTTPEPVQRGDFVEKYALQAIINSLQQRCDELSDTPVTVIWPAAPQQEVKSALEHGMQRYAGAMQKLSEGDK